ncbi:MAG: endonuclease NucS [Protaetiibacter sp.]
MANLGSENTIRDHLKSRLELIEPGLTFVATNYHLRNEDGADGYVDILARDSTGAFVVLELKKAAGSSRQAMHEIGKYLDLLCRDKGLPPDRVRGVVVSTDWHELLVPFSYYVHSSSFALSGFQLQIAGDGVTPTAASPVSPLPQSEPRALTPAQRRIDERTVSDLDQQWVAVKSRLQSLDVADYIGLHLSDPEDSRMIVLVLGTVVDVAARIEMRTVLEMEDAWDEEDLDDLSNEDVVLLGLEYEGLPLGVCYPEKVGALLATHGWTLDQIERVGVFQDEDLFPETDLRDATTGWAGGMSTTRYAGRARVGNSAQWASFRGAISSVIADSEGWVAPVRKWLDELQASSPRWDISIQVYDEHDFLQVLAWSYKTERWHEGVPMLVAAVEALDGDSFGLFGFLGWDGTVVNLREALPRAYRNVGDWGDQRGSYSQGEANTRLMDAWHLHYVVLEKRALSDRSTQLDVVGGSLQRSEVDNGGEDDSDASLRRLFMVDFIRAHADQLEEITAYLREHLIVDSSAGVQMHIFDSNSDTTW